MADVFSPAKRSNVMSHIRSTGNKDTELALIGIFHSQHITGWHRHQPVFGKPDFVFRKLKVVVFVDGCFWHCCPLHANQPRSNADFWARKLLNKKLGIDKSRYACEKWIGVSCEFGNMRLYLRIDIVCFVA